MARTMRLRPFPFRMLLLAIENKIFFEKLYLTLIYRHLLLKNLMQRTGHIKFL